MTKHATQPPDQHRSEYALARAQAVMEAYLASRPESLFHEKIRQGRLTLAEAYQLLKEVARDPKTDVDRADLLEATMMYEINESKNHGWPLSVAVIDIDDFKKINTELTHVGADQLLKHIAKILEAGVRQSDILLLGASSVVRWGGEEFVLLLVGAKLVQSIDVCERLRLQIEKDLADRRPLGSPVTVSIGVAEWDPRRMQTWTELLALADQRLMQAKTRGKNQVVSS